MRISWGFHDIMTSVTTCKATSLSPTLKQLCDAHLTHIWRLSWRICYFKAIHKKTKTKEMGKKVSITVRKQKVTKNKLLLLLGMGGASISRSQSLNSVHTWYKPLSWVHVLINHWKLYLVINKNGLQVLENIYAAQRLILMTGVDIIRTFLTARCENRSFGNNLEKFWWRGGVKPPDLSRNAPEGLSHLAVRNRPNYVHTCH